MCHYHSYCDYYEISKPSPKSKICVLINRLFDEPPRKSLKDLKTDKYMNFYIGVRFYDPDESQDIEDKISLPPWMTFGLEKKQFLRFYVNTNVCHDGERVIFTMIYDTVSKAFCMYVKDILLNLEKQGICPYAPLTDRLVNGIGLVARKLRLCEGSKKDFSQYLTTSSVPKYREISAFSEIACSSEVRHPRYFSKSCLGVLLLTAERNSSMCQVCSKDLTQVCAKKKGKKRPKNNVCPTDDQTSSEDEGPDMKPFKRQVVEDSGCESEEDESSDGELDATVSEN